MRIELVEIDSKVMNSNVLDIKDFDSSIDFSAFEDAFVAEFDPVYVTCKLQLKNMVDVLRIQDHGFKFIECQIQSRFAFSDFCKSDTENFTYTMVSNDGDLEKVIEIAKTSITEDRFSKDSEIESSLSGLRYEHYLRESYQRSTDEIWLLKSKASGEAIFFRSHRNLDKNEVLLLLGGTSAKYMNLGIGMIAWNFTVNQMLENKVKGATTHISASNIPVFNLEINHIGFKVRNSFAVLRKIYRNNGEQS
jgi:hypothetical protein